ncbi:MAG: hypothetical protein Q8P84_04465 [Deltaproteobacteria bacterium]|nr:hypothetical protein [Deltaproteobacteria bacterium]
MCLFFLTACGESALYNDLSQEDANKVMVLLQQSGISATLNQTIKQNEILWSITVPKENLSKAREIIVTSNVISPRAPGLKEVYQGKGSGGWIRTPAEEKARYLLALKGEIINSLKKLPDVVDVDVVLNVPEEADIGAVERKRPAASVVIKAHTPKPGEASLSEIKVQEFVANSVEGMSPRDVAVILHYIAPSGTIVRPGETVTLPKGGTASTVLDISKAKEAGEASVPLMGLKLDSSSRDRLKVYLIVFFAVLVILSIALIVMILQASRVRSELKNIKGSGAAGAIEGQVMDERPRLRGPPDQ